MDARNSGTTNQRELAGISLLLVPSRIYAHGDVVLDGDGEERGRIDLEIGQGRRDSASDVMGVALNDLVKGDVSIVRCVAGELNGKVAIERRRVDGGLRQTKAHGDDRKLRATRDLKHVQVAVCVAGVECFYLDGQQEIALSGVANALAASSVAHAIDLMEWMRHVIGQDGLVENPGVIRLGEGG